MIGYKHKVTLSQSDKFRKEWNTFLDNEPKVVLLIRDNFIRPISNGWDPFSELTGKYKPSFDVDFTCSVVKDAFIAQAKKHNLFHYHFGYPIYKGGSDDKYQGDVSDGIIHTKLITNEAEKIIEHRIIQICKLHPSPFVVPFDRICF